MWRPVQFCNYNWTIFCERNYMLFAYFSSDLLKSYSCSFFSMRVYLILKIWAKIWQKLLLAREERALVSDNVIFYFYFFYANFSKQPHDTCAIEKLKNIDFFNRWILFLRSFNFREVCVIFFETFSFQFI